jgi:CDP-glucose 4,6-dehydratase
MEDLVNCWRGKRVFLTGHTGFKGSWLALWLAEMGAHVCGYALDPEAEPNLFSIASVASVVEDVRADIRDYPRIQAEMARFAPEVVFHLAAQPLVRRSYADPLGTYATNVLGTAHVLEAVRNTPGVRAVVCVTTDKCYQNQEWVWPYRETDALGGYDPYASSKACSEIVVAAYRQSFFAGTTANHGAGLATARAGNVIGGGDWSEDRLVPDLIGGFVERRPVPIRRPQAIRPWQHVLEPVYGYLLLAARLLADPEQFSSAFNLGPGDGDEWTVSQIANRMIELWGEGASWAPDPVPGAHEAATLKLDSSKARSQLGWRPHLNLETALDWTVSWYRLWREGNDMQAATRAQISVYQQLLRPGLISKPQEAGVIARPSNG